jgi:hypothetical protein
MPLREVLYELSFAKEVPDAELLDDFVRRYPEHAVALTDFAIDLVVERLRPAEQTAAVAETKAISPAVSRAMSKYQNALHANRVAKAAPAAQSVRHATLAASPFAPLDRQAFRQLAQDLNANTLFVCKLRDRHVEPQTMTKGFLGLLAEKLRSLPEVIAAYFATEPQPVLQGQFCKADEKPVAGLRQSFEEAVRTSGLTDDQQRYLLSL